MLPHRPILRATTLFIGLTFAGTQAGFGPLFCQPANAAATALAAPAGADTARRGSWLLTPVAPMLDHSVDNAGSSSGQESQESDLTVEDVTVEGNRLVPSEDILGVIKTHRGDRFDRDQVMRDLKAVNGMGYFDDRSLQAIPEMGGGGVLLKIRVQENAPVTSFAFQGNSVIQSDELSKLFAEQLGKPQNLTQLSQAIDRVEQAYHERGFMLARVVDVKDDPDGSVGIKVDEGTIGDVKIVGNKKTKDYIIRRAIKLKAGDVYNERTLTADLRKLYGNGFFQDIKRSLTPDPNNPDKYTLKVEVDEKRTGSIGLGGGVDTLTGPFGSFSVSDNNFQGRGQSVSMSAQVGTAMFNGMANTFSNAGSTFLPTGAAARTYNVSADWINPSLFGTNTSMGVSAFGRNYASMMVDSSMQRSLGASVTFNKPLGDHFSASLSTGVENTTLKAYGDSVIPSAGNVLPGLITRAEQLGYAHDPYSATAFAQRVRQTQLKGGLYASFTPTLYYDTRDSVFDPHKGTFAKLTGGPSIGITNSSFGKLGASVSKYYEINKNTTLAMNLQGGTTLGAVPQFAQFRLGGFNGMRGYRQFSDLGTGTGMLMGSLELRRHLPFLPKGDNHSAGGKVLKWADKNVRWDTFFDYGGVGGNSLVNNMYSRNMMGASVGVGLRINVPMLGMVRLDYGMPLISTAMGRMIPRFTVGFGDKF
jgi:outer membrane protein insertion porin family